MLFSAFSACPAGFESRELTHASAAHFSVFRVTNTSREVRANAVSCGSSTTLQLDRHATYEAHLLGGLLLRTVAFDLRGASNFVVEIARATEVDVRQVSRRREQAAGQT